MVQGTANRREGSPVQIWIEAATTFGASGLDRVLTIVVPALAYRLTGRRERPWTG